MRNKKSQIIAVVIIILAVFYVIGININVPIHEQRFGIHLYCSPLRQSSEKTGTHTIFPTGFRA